METYLINGHEIQYDTFDLVNLELLEAEVKRIGSIGRNDGESDIAYMREVCEEIRDFFDTLCGEGTSEKCFGKRMNAKELLDAYTEFVRAVSEQANSFQTAYAPLSASTPPNREQRRALERQRRREEAQVRAARKQQEKVTALEA